MQGAATKEQQRRYKDALTYINSTANELNPEKGFLAPYPLYLIDQLFSGIYSVEDTRILEVCSSAVVRVLDMICDDIFDVGINKNVMEDHIAVIIELKRIDNDIALAKKLPKIFYRLLT